MPDTMLKALHILANLIFIVAQGVDTDIVPILQMKKTIRSSILLMVTELLSCWAKTWTQVTRILKPLLLTSPLCCFTKGKGPKGFERGGLFFFFSISKEDSPRKKFFTVGVEEDNFTLFVECDSSLWNQGPVVYQVLKME